MAIARTWTDLRVANHPVPGMALSRIERLQLSYFRMEWRREGGKSRRRGLPLDCGTGTVGIIVGSGTSAVFAKSENNPVAGPVGIG
jgi:hypothetical protein